MNTHDPSDIAPLSYGAGLALGLMLILGLPAEEKQSQPSTAPAKREPTGCRLTEAESPATPIMPADCA
jgi:hypothetical protein